MKLIYLLVFTLFCNFSFANSTKIKTGIWQAKLQLNDSTDLPITFELLKVKKSYVLYVINAEERIKLDDFQVSKDSIFIPFKTFDSELRLAVHTKTNISGNWHNYYRGPAYKIPFTAVYGQTNRYPLQPNRSALTGKWEVTFNYDKQPEKAIGLFHSIDPRMNDNQLKGTFLTETGDYRFLEGASFGDSLYLSTFDGSHAFLFQAALKSDTLWGQFLSGTHYQSNWYAVRNKTFELSDPDSLTYLINDEPITLALPDLNNNIYHYPNDAVRNKVTLIQIMGTWCPNCLDESRYLAKQKEKYGDQLEIIAVSFEVQPTVNGAIEKIRKYKETLNLDYTFLVGGDACKKCASNLFPMLNTISSFPTLIFIDKKGAVRKIHTGFNGPGTGIYYENYMEKTNAFLDLLISEN